MSPTVSIPWSVMLKRCLALTGMVVLLLVVGWFFGRDTETNDMDHEYTDYKVEAGSDLGVRAAAWIEPDQRTVLISNPVGACDKHVRVKVREAADTVKIAITVTRYTGMCKAIAYHHGYKITLHSPLGDRKLIGIDDVPYDRTDERPIEGSRSENREIPVKVNFEE